MTDIDELPASFTWSIARTGLEKLVILSISISLSFSSSNRPTNQRSYWRIQLSVIRFGGQSIDRDLMHTPQRVHVSGTGIQKMPAKPNNSVDQVEIEHVKTREVHIHSTILSSHSLTFIQS